MLYNVWLFCACVRFAPGFESWKDSRTQSPTAQALACAVFAFAAGTGEIMTDATGWLQLVGRK